MIRCGWCGAQNYAIDSWCASCSRHLDWAPSAPAAALTPPPPPPAVIESSGPGRGPRRRRRILLAPVAAALGLAIALALPVAIRFTVAGRPELAALPNTAMRPDAPAASSTPAATTEPTPTPEAASTPEATPTPAESATQPALPAEPAPAAEAPPAQTPPPDAEPAPLAGDPAAAIALFYQDISGRDFGAAAALWSSRMQARYPPAVYIDHRFAATQQISLQAARVVANRGGQATVNVRVVEVLGGQTRHWVGSWELVNTGSGWLLNQPNLRADS